MDEKSLPCIEYSRSSGQLTENGNIYICIRGPTLDECRKHFDEIINSRGA
jgi:hypothetical protein